MTERWGVKVTNVEIREIIPPKDVLNQRMVEEIRSSNAVALHVRWFDAPGTTATHNVSAGYYQRAITLMERQVESPSGDRVSSKLVVGFNHPIDAEIIGNTVYVLEYGGKQSIWAVTLPR